jgi:Mn-containing catalase
VGKGQPWNQGEEWEYVDHRPDQGAVDGGSGAATATLAAAEMTAINNLAERTKSRTDVNPTTGADLGAGPGAGKTKAV